MLMLPVSVSAQLANGTEAYVPRISTPTETQYQPSQVVGPSEGDFYSEAFCKSPAKECQNKCWTGCSSGSTWYCGSSGALCCQNSAKFCANNCWNPCSSSQIWVCTSTGAVCEPKSKCTNSNYPYPCGGGCWSCGGAQLECNSGSPTCVYRTCSNVPGYPDQCENSCWSDCTDTWDKDFTFACNNGNGDCVFDRCIHPDYPNKCGNDCWSNCPSGKTWNCKSDGTIECVQNCVDSDGDGYGSGCSSGSDCNDNDANINPGKAEICDDGKDNNCDSSTDENCCPSANPYNCAKTGTCWTKEKCDEAISCGGQWWACTNSAKYNPACVNSHIGCCEPQYPYYCPANNWCFSQDGFCDGRTVYTCSGKSSVCNTKSDVGQCFGDTLRCCPPGESWWESDKQCHKSSEPQKCAVPDGSSANCDCDSDSECAKADPSRPYCGETYGKRESSGYHACLSSKPEYCGNGNCGSWEDYNNCASDCAAPKGTVNVDVAYIAGNLKNKPIQGAYVSLDGTSKGITGSGGKLNFEASYGNHNVKVECPDKSLCNTKAVNVDGSEYLSFGCDCKVPVSFSNLRTRFKAKTNTYPRGYPVANVDVLVDDSFKGSSNQFGAVDIEGLTTGNHRIDVYLMVLEDGQEKRYIGGTSLTLTKSYEEKSYTLVKGSSPSAAYTALENDNETFSLYETNVTPEIIWIPIIIAVVWIAGTAWDAYDYEKCVERQANAWDPNKEDWSKFTCNTEMDEEQLNDCVTKLMSKNQNTIDGCGFEAGMLALNALPQESIPKTGIKLAVKIGKAVRLIPFIDDAAKGAYRTYRFVRGTDTFFTVTDKLNKGAKYVFKLADNSLKIFDNAVGFIVNKITRNPDSWKKISEKVENLLLNTRPSDIPTPKLGNIGNIQGILGEKAKDEYIAVVKEALGKEGTELAIEKGAAKTAVNRFASSQKYVVEYSDTGGGITIFEKTAKGTKGQAISEIDGLVFINDKPIVIEAKASNAGHIAKSLDDFDNKKFFDKKIKPIEELTGQTPEILLLIPKGEAAKSLGFFKPKLSSKIDELGKYLENKNIHLAYDEFPADFADFEKSARAIKKQAATAINQEVAKHLSSEDYKYAVDGIKRFLNKDFDLSMLPKSFSSEKKAQFVVALGKNAESFKISGKGLAKIEFIKPEKAGPSAWFETRISVAHTPGVIKIKDNLDPDYVINLVVPHELGHAKVYDEVGELGTKVYGVDPDMASEILEYFFEISGNVNAMKYAANKVAFTGRLKKLPLLSSDITSDKIKEILELGEFGQVATARSLAKRLGLQEKVSIIDNALSKTKYSDDVEKRAKELFELYDEYGEIDGTIPGDVLKARMKELYHKTLELAKKGVIP